MIFTDTVGMLEQLGANTPTFTYTVLAQQTLPTDTELLPCPFCGCEAHWAQWRDTLEPNASWVECMNPDCMAMTQTYYDPDSETAKGKAVAAWNRRANANL